MSVSDRLQETTSPVAAAEPNERQLLHWGGIAGLVGVASMVATAAVVGVQGLPDASDVETLTDFADIESGRIAEHFLYLAALVAFSLHVFVLNRLLRRHHPAAALFGTVAAGFGLVIMAASSLLHVSTSPLAELYTDPTTPASELPAIEYAWHGAQSVFDTMLATGVLLVPLGFLFFAVAMRMSPSFGTGPTMAAFALAIAGLAGAAIAVIDPGSLASAAAVVAMVLFFATTSWRTLRLADEQIVDLTNSNRRAGQVEEPARRDQ